MFEPAVVDAAVNFLADLAGEGGALELGTGTGRIALPLSRRGVHAKKGRLTSIGIYQMVKRRSEEAGLVGFTHTCFERGSRIAGWRTGARNELMEITGWKSRAMNDRYAKATATTGPRRRTSVSALQTRW